MFKILRGISKVDSSRWFSLTDSSRTRSHRLKLAKLRSRLDVRKHFFSQRVVNTWNNLPEYVVEAASVNSFKNRHDKYISGCK